MDRQKSLTKELALFKKRLSKKMPIDKMIFFWSRAIGKAKKYSDVDLIIVSKKFNKKKFHQRPIKLYDDWNLDYPVDFLCYTPREFNKLKNKICIVQQAILEGIVI